MSNYRQICRYCANAFASQQVLDNHLLLCRIIHEDTYINDGTVLSPEMTFKVISSLTKRVLNLEQQIASLKAPKRDQVEEWINHFVNKPSTTFDELAHYIPIEDRHLQSLMRFPFSSVLETILEDCKCLQTLISIKNQFYAYKDESFVPISKDDILAMLNQLQLRIMRRFRDTELIKESELKDKVMSKITIYNVKSSKHLMPFLHRLTKIDMDTAHNYNTALTETVGEDDTN